MKHIILLFSLLVLSIAPHYAFAQNDNEIVKDTVIQVPGINAEQIHSALRLWFVESAKTDSIDWDWTTYSDRMFAKNVNKEKRRGLELSVNHEFTDELSGYASYTYVQVKQDTGYGYTKDESAKPNIYRAGLKYKNDEWIFTMNANYVNGQSEKQYVDSSYFTLDLGAQYKLTKNAKLFVNGYNLTNARFAEYGGLYSSGEAKYPMAGRSFIIGAEYSF